ncbi:MAG: MFS transporter [Alphaproteobacteria bacterium]|nr:MFS transporter [Alphaproteobacteria bacterium]TAD90710.1 MAG: MFS transporter [Alphaproteobacteria bacterium]
MASPATPPFAASDRWFLALLGVSQIVAWGSLFYTFPVMVALMAPEFGVDAPGLYWVVSLGLAISSLGAYPVGRAIDAGYGRAVMTVGGVAGALGLWLWSLATAPVWLGVVFVVIGAASAMTLYEPGFAVAARRLGPTARSGIAQLTLWGGFASTVMIPIVQAGVEWFGWRQTLLLQAGLVLVVCAGLPLLVIQSRRDRGGAGPAAEAEAERSQIVPKLLSYRVFWVFAAAMVLYSLVMTGFITHLFPLLLERGLPSESVVAVFAVVGPAQVAARLLVWRVADTLPARRLGLMAMSGFTLSMVGFALLPTTVPLMIAAAVLYGASNGVMTISRSAAILEMLSRHHYGTVAGTVMAPAIAAMAAAPWAAALGWGVRDSYTLPLVMAVGLAGTATALFWLAGRWSLQGTNPLANGSDSGA